MGAWRWRPDSKAATGSQVTGRNIPAATAVMKTMARRTGEPGAPVGWSRRGRGCARGCVCSQGPETALAYALPVWSAMADKVRSGGGQGETRRGSPLVSMAIGWRCSGGSRPSSFGSRAVPTRDRDDDDGVALHCGNYGDVGRSFFFLYPLSLLALSLGSGERWTATRWRRGTGERLGLRGWGFYSRAHPWSSVDGGWRTRCDRRASSEVG